MNPFLEAERARKRESLLQATEADLDKIVAPAHGPASRCAARTKSLCAPTGCCAAARSPSISGSTSATTTSATPATGLHRRRGEAGRHLRTTRQRRNQRTGQQPDRVLLQGAGLGRAGLPRLQHRPGHPPHPPPHRDPGPDARVLAPAGRDGVLLAAGFRRSGRSLPVRMNPCWSRPIGGGSQPVCGPAPSGNVRAVWRRVQVWRLPVLSSLLITFIFAIPPSQFASARWKSTSAAALCRGVVV
jgi:hypothetical protein